MRNIFIIFLLLNSFLGFAQEIDSETTVDIKPYFNIQDHNNYQFATQDIRIEGNDTVQNDYVKYKAYVEVLDLYKDQYTIHWHIYDIENSNKNITRNPLSFLQELDIYYTMDATGKFSDFQHNNFTLVQFRTALEQVQDQYADQPSVQKILDQVDEHYEKLEQVNSIFAKDIAQFHHFFGRGRYDVNKTPIVANTYIDNLFNDNPTPAKTDFRLEDHSPYSNTYILTSTSVADEEWLKESWFKYLERTARQMDVEAPKRDEIDSNIVYTIDTTNRLQETGWLSYSMQVKRVNFLDTAFTQRRKIEYIP